MATKQTAQQPPVNGIIGMWAFLIVDEKIAQRVYILTKADEYYVCQIISPLTGEPNIAKLLTADQLKDWFIIPSRDISIEVFADYCLHGRWRFGVSF